MTSNSMNAAVSALESQAIAAMQQGRQPEALKLWAQVLRLQPVHVVALTQVGQAAFVQGDFQSALSVFQAAAEADGRDARQWVNVALAHKNLGDEAGEEAALFKALTVDSGDLMALVLRGALFERQGKTHLAASAYGAAATVAPPLERLIPELRPAVTHALAFREQHRQNLTSFVDQFLAPHLQECSASALDRFTLSVDILLGRRQRFDAQPMRYFVPHLPVVEFFERSRFPWLDGLEAATDDIRDEFLGVLRQDDENIPPYITYGQDQPVAQWAELNHSPRWSAFHLVKDGKSVPENASRCPRTMAAWSLAPAPDQPGRTPVAMYSLLRPKTRIPPHVGASNARLVTHLPLIVPPGCGFRVGNTVREWVPGKAWVFDDTIQHEAWNDSEQLRVVLIFDIWHPDLNADERRMITALNTALTAFSGGVDAYDV